LKKKLKLKSLERVLKARENLGRKFLGATEPRKNQTFQSQEWKRRSRKLLRNRSKASQLRLSGVKLVSLQIKTTIESILSVYLIRDGQMSVSASFFSFKARNLWNSSFSQL